MITATRYGAFLLLLTGLPLVLAANRILTLWVGPVYGVRGTRILEVLVVANMIRLSLTPYAVTLIGTGQQRLVMFIPLLEGFSNLLLSVVLGYSYGAIGVAIGTLGGSLIALIGNLYYNMPRTNDIQFEVHEYLRDGILRPLVCASPCILFTLAVRVFPESGPIPRAVGVVVTVAITILCFWYWGLVGSERDKLKPFLVFAEGTEGS
jgi:O-antigen/teichoic acid export membrane protein